MPDRPAERKPNQISGIVALLGYFLIFCSLILFGAAATRTWKANQVSSRWRPAVATIQDCAPLVDHPFDEEVGGTIFYLRCHLNYQFDDHSHNAILRTTSARSLSVRDDIEIWTASHRSGSTLSIRVNPSSPEDFAVVEPLPVEQWPSAPDALASAIPFSIAGAILAFVGTRIARRKVRAAASPGTLLN